MNNKRFLLPYGDALREFLSQPGITKADIKAILRRRGVFFSDDEKVNTVPLLIKTGVSPFELEELVDKVKAKEDNPKVHTQSIPWAGGNRKLLDAIPPELNIQEIIDQPFSNYKVLGAPNFKAIDGNQDHIEMEFKVERYDLTKSWDKNTSQFSGKITLKKSANNLDVSMSLNHTSQETKFVADKISRKVVQNMKDEGFVHKESQIRRIRFNDFSNSNRVAFLQDLSQKQLNNPLYFKDTRDIGFRPDKKTELPPDISWMEDKIKNMILQGSDLHTTFFVKDKKYHEYLEVYRIEAEYSFDQNECSGDCRIVFEFSEFISRDKNDAELLIKVASINFVEKTSSISTNIVKERLLSQLESAKLKLHEQYRK
ncbi:hypothetical protein RA178_09580 [Shewanella oncorhynchi]|uniref:GAPS4b N-terminal domain-containing protein n=1 Tax=Shewanella oncorhynchi TaxID=2726434 RepID=A0AA50KHQ1_9GAMM|nr:hypothetical protein [Shewanella oncorhynchi]WMB74822.1 hypothetical protein RA178_09580 [Shewanella oncorhynchi]